MLLKVLQRIGQAEPLIKPLTTTDAQVRELLNNGIVVLLCPFLNLKPL